MINPEHEVFSLYPNLKLFFKDLENLSSKHKIRVNLDFNNSVVPYPVVNDGVVSDGFDCSGFFCDPEGDLPEAVLAVACNMELGEWIATLLHESSHMDQWIEQIPCWKEQYFYKNTDPYQIIDEWINGKDVDIDVIKKCISIAVEIEFDCEKRTVEKIKKYNLESLFNVEEYIQKANSYVLYFNFILNHRKWYSVAPHSTKSIWKKFPKTFPEDYNALPKRLENIYKKI